jgi:hypothetical protein
MKKKTSPWLYILLALLFGCAIIVFIMRGLDVARFFSNPSVLWKSLVRPILRLALFISLGLFVGQCIEAMGWTARLAMLARPFMRWGHLTEKMGAAFTTAFFSGTASLSMLISFYKDKVITEKEITLCVLLNTFPSYFLHLPSTFFIILPLAGSAGVIYLLITFFAALLRLSVILIWSRKILPESNLFELASEKNSWDWKKVVLNIKLKFLKRLMRIMLLVLPVYILILLLSQGGLFMWIRKNLAQYVGSTFIPIDAMSIVVVSLITEFSSGYAAAGAMLKSGALNVVQTALALLVGNILATPIRAFRHQMPIYLGIFSPGMGTRLVLMTQTFRLVSLIVVGIVFLIVVALAPGLHF